MGGVGGVGFPACAVNDRQDKSRYASVEGNHILTVCRECRSVTRFSELVNILSAKKTLMRIHQQQHQATQSSIYILLNKRHSFFQISSVIRSVLVL